MERKATTPSIPLRQPRSLASEAGSCFDPTREAGAEEGTEDPDRVALHLLAGCETCSERTRRWWRGEGGELLLRKARAALEEAPGRLRRQRRAAEEWLERLRALPFGRQYTLLASVRRAHTPAMVDLLIAGSEARLASDAGAAIRRAELAREVAERLGDEHGLPLAVDYLARADLALGRALRRAGDLEAAGRALGRAERRVEAGTGDPLERARLLEEEGALNAERGALEEAADALRRAVRIYERIGQLEAAGRGLIRLARIRRARGRPAGARRILRRAASYLEGGLEPRWLVALSHELALVSATSGLRERALAYLEAAETVLYRRLVASPEIAALRRIHAAVLRQVERATARRATPGSTRRRLGCSRWR